MVYSIKWILGEMKRKRERKEIYWSVCFGGFVEGKLMGPM